MGELAAEEPRPDRDRGVTSVESTPPPPPPPPPVSVVVIVVIVSPFPVAVAAAVVVLLVLVVEEVAFPWLENGPDRTRRTKAQTGSPSRSPT